MFGKLLSGVQATYPNEDWGLVGSTVLTGLLVVFLILVFLIFIFWLMGKVMVGLDNRKKRANEKKAQEKEPASVTEVKPVEVQTPVQEEYEDENDEEIIAVIAAAVAAYSEADGKQYRIASISRKKEKTKRNSWNGAGVVENTRPF